jgi:hypothetical protein
VIKGTERDMRDGSSFLSKPIIEQGDQPERSGAVSQDRGMKRPWYVQRTFGETVFMRVSTSSESHPSILEVISPWITGRHDLEPLPA